VVADYSGSIRDSVRSTPRGQSPNQKNATMRLISRSGWCRFGGLCCPTCTIQSDLPTVAFVDTVWCLISRQVLPFYLLSYGSHVRERIQICYVSHNNVSHTALVNEKRPTLATAKATGCVVSGKVAKLCCNHFGD